MSVVLFGVSRICVDLLPVELQPFLVRAALTIVTVFAGLWVHHRRTTRITSEVGRGHGVGQQSSAQDAQESESDDGEGEMAALRPAPMADTAQDSSNGLQTIDADSDGDASNLRRVACTNTVSTPAASHAIDSSSRCTILRRGSRYGEVELCASMLLALYIGVQLLLW